MTKRQPNPTARHDLTASFFTTLPAWLRYSLYSLLALFIVALPLLYDRTVPEVAGDIRWYAGNFVGFLGLALMAFGAFLTPERLKAQLPLVGYVIIAFALTIPISWIDAYNPYRAAFFSVHWLSYIALFFLFFWVRTPQFQKILLLLLILPLAFNCTLGILQYHDMTDYKFHQIIALWPRDGFVLNWLKGSFLQSAVPGTTFANKNLAASYTVLLLPLVLYHLCVSKALWQKIMASIVLFLAVTFLMYSRSRASWIATLAAIAFGALYMLLSPVWRTYLMHMLREKISAGLIVVSLLCAFYVGNFPSPLNSHGLSRAASEQFKTLGRFDNNEFGPRLAYNLNGTKIVQDHPINGVGLGNFHTIYPMYHDARYPTPRHGYNVMARPQRAHNDVMQMFIEVGILGGTLFASLWFFAAFMAWKLSRVGTTHIHHPALPLALFTSITGLCLNALADFPLQMPTAPILLFVFLALLTSLYVQAYPVKSISCAHLHKIPTLVWKLFFAALTIVLLLTTFVVTQYNLDRRAGAQQLKFAMQRMQANVIDATTLKHLEKSYQSYPYNTRLLEYRAIAYHNFQGKPAIPMHLKQKTTAEILAIDPYAANHAINVAYMHMRSAESAQKLGDVVSFKREMAQAQENLALLKKIAPFSYFTYGVEGMLYFVLKDVQRSLNAFTRALEIKPDFPIAKQAIPILKRSLASPTVR